MKFDKKEAAGQPLPFSVPKNPQWVMLAALLLSYAAGYEYVDRCLGEMYCNTREKAGCGSAALHAAQQQIIPRPKP